MLLVNLRSRSKKIMTLFIFKIMVMFSDSLVLAYD